MCLFCLSSWGGVLYTTHLKSNTRYGQTLPSVSHSAPTHARCALSFQILLPAQPFYVVNPQSNLVSDPAVNRPLLIVCTLFLLLFTEGWRIPILWRPVGGRGVVGE